MQTGTMSIPEHRETAREFLEESEREFAAGQVPQSLDKMWGAAGHAITAAALQRDLPHENHADMREAVRQLAAESGDDGFLVSGFVLAGVFHANSYHGLYSSWLEPESLEQARESARLLIGRLLAFSDDAETG